jgi:hypothetical protein
MTNDIDQLRVFRAADAVPDPDSRASARAALLECIGAATTTARPRRAPRRVSRAARHRRLLAGGVTLAVAGATLAFIVGLGSGGIQTATAAQVLHKAAAVAASARPADLNAGQFWYSSSEERSVSEVHAGGTVFHVIQSMHSELWIDRDGNGRVVQADVGRPQFPSEADRQAWIAAGSPKLTQDGPTETLLGTTTTSSDGTTINSGYSWVYDFYPQPLTYQQAQALPTDTEALTARIHSAAVALVDAQRRAPTWLPGPGNVPQAMFALVSDLLREGPLPPAVRAALYNVAAGLPGITLLGNVKDSRGRAGVGVALGGEGQRRELVFDPETAMLLETRTINLSDGAVLADGLWNLTSGVVDSSTGRP